MRNFFVVYLPAILFVAVSVLLFFWRTPIEYLSLMIEGQNTLSYVIFVLLLAGATVFMPMTVIPIIPVVAPLLGPFTTGVLSVIGWTLGGVGAFLVARHLGRPAISRFVSLEEIDNVSKKIPEDAQFLGIIVLRLTLPVDVISYVIGFTSSISLFRYTLATLIGVSYFSFAFAYLGNAFFEGDIVALQLVGGISLIVFFVGWYILLRSRKKS